MFIKHFITRWAIVYIIYFIRETRGKFRKKKKKTIKFVGNLFRIFFPIFREKGLNTQNLPCVAPMFTALTYNYRTLVRTRNNYKNNTKKCKY